MSLYLVSVSKLRIETLHLDAIGRDASERDCSLWVYIELCSSIVNPTNQAFQPMGNGGLHKVSCFKLI